MGSITTGEIGADPFYRFPSKLKEPWSSTDSDAYAPMSYMEFDSDKATGGGGLSGIEIIWADQTETFIRASDMLENYDEDTNSYWSAVFAVSNNTFTKATPTYDSTATLWDDVGTDQTKYRLRLITQGLDSEGSAVNAAISMYGQYRESILCVNGEPVTVLVKIS